MGYHRERNRCEIDREGEKEMTRKEKVAEMMPEAMNKVTAGGVKGCPHHYPFLNIGKDGSECLIHDITRSGSELFSKCTKCWNTEWEEATRPQWKQDILDKFMRVI